jgi:hypothetical protein
MASSSTGRSSDHLEPADGDDKQLAGDRLAELELGSKALPQIASEEIARRPTSNEATPPTATATSRTAAPASIFSRVFRFIVLSPVWEVSAA